LTDKISRFEADGLVLENGEKVEADVVVVARACSIFFLSLSSFLFNSSSLSLSLSLVFLLFHVLCFFNPITVGHKINWAPSFLSSLPSNNTDDDKDNEKNKNVKKNGDDVKSSTSTSTLSLRDLHNYVFLGRNPRLAVCCDAVWFNVPHGPQAQIECFRSALRAIRAGPAAERRFARTALAPSSWGGATGEPLSPLWGVSEADKRREAHARSLAAGEGALELLKSRALLTLRRALLTLFLVPLVLLEAWRSPRWLGRGAAKFTEANERAREEQEQGRKGKGKSPWRLRRSASEEGEAKARGKKKA